MAKRYCVNCGDVLPVGQNYCLTCGTINEEPVKKKIENTEPITYIPDIEPVVEEPVSVEPEPVKEPEAFRIPEFPDMTKETPVIPDVLQEEPAEEVPAETEPEEPELFTAPLFEEPVEEEAEPEEEGGTEELPLIEEETHMTDMLADTAPHASSLENSDISIPVFPNPRRSASGTEILEGTPIDESVTTRVYKNPLITEEEPVVAKTQQTATSSTAALEEEDFYEDEEEEEAGSTKTLISILLVLLALLLGAFAYIWFMRPDILPHGTKKPAESSSVVTPASSESAGSASESAQPESSTSEGEDQPQSNTGNSGYSIDLTDALASVDPALLSGDPVSVGDVTGEVIGYANVDIETLLVFADHSTNSECLGHARFKAHYEVDQIYEDGEYTWYEIAENMWIPDSNGQWITYEAK